MVFRFILADPTPNNPETAARHDNRVAQIRSAQVTSIFFPTPKSRYRPLEFLDYPGKYAVITDSHGTPVCAVDVLTVKLCTLRTLSPADITHTFGPDNLDEWKKWACGEWEQPLSQKNYWETPIDEDTTIVRVDFQLVDAFSEIPEPHFGCKPVDISLYNSLPQDPATVIETLLSSTPPLPPEIRMEGFRTLGMCLPALPTKSVPNPDLSRTLSTATRLVRGFGNLPVPPHDVSAPCAIRTWANTCLEFLGSSSKQSWSHMELSTHYPEISRDYYRATVRALAHLRRRTYVAEEVLTQHLCITISKTRLATEIPTADFAASPATADFIAYFSSLLAVRPWYRTDDTILDPFARMLLDRALNDPTCNHEMIAHVYCTPHLVSFLSPAAIRRLIGVYGSHLERLATRLKKLWQPYWGSANFHVTSGANITAWNATVRAWERLRVPYNVLNQARNAPVADNYLGKVPCLFNYSPPNYQMSKDIAIFHKLPLPWDVALGLETCTEALVRCTCEKLGVDPHQSGWSWQ